MPAEIDRNQTRQLIEQGAQLVEVMPAHEYQEDHLPGAISIPLKTLNKAAVAGLDKSRPVVVYCYDTQ